jgi:hypothetical protein
MAKSRRHGDRDAPAQSWAISGGRHVVSELAAVSTGHLGITMEAQAYA